MHKKIISTGVMSPSFPRGGRNTLSSEESAHEASQSGQGGGCGSNTDTSRRDHDSRGGTGLRDRSIVEADSLIKT